MASENAAVSVAAPIANSKSGGMSGALWSLWRFTRKRPLGSIGGFIVLLMLIVAILANAIAPRDPFEINTSSLFQPPSLTFPFGTDDFGRDILSRVI